MIDLTPLEVRKKKGDFRKALRGYEPALVDDFLDIVADRLDDLVRENTMLKDRATRAEAQLAEHRERERALTDALVTAQEMREGVRAQAAAEAEQTTKSAKQDAETLLRTAKLEAEQTLRSANNEAEQTLKAAEQEATQMRSQALHAMKREEEALSRLRARQQQLVQSYRTFLSREMEEVETIAGTLDEGAPVDGKGSAAPRASKTRTPNVATFPGAPEPAASDLGLTVSPPPIPFDAVGTVMGAVEVEILPDPLEEPFAPEPVDDWEEYREPVSPRDVDLRVAGEIAKLVDDPIAADELALHDAISHDEVAYAEIAYDAVADQPAFDALPPDPYGAASYGQEDEGLVSYGGMDDLEAEEEIGAPDHDADALLENALKAGYRLGLDDESEAGEPLDEAADEDEDEAARPKGWLDAIIDDEER